MPSTQHQKIRRLYFLCLLLLFICGVPLLLLFASGYRFSDGLELVKRGGIYISVSRSGALVMVDDEFSRQTSFFVRDVFQQNVRPGEHTVRVTHPETHEWYRRFLVESQKVTPLFPFLVPRTFDLDPIVRFEEDQSATSSVPRVETGEYQRVSELFFERVASSTAIGGFVRVSTARQAVSATTTQATSSVLDHVASEFRATDGKTEIWHTDSSLFAYWRDQNDWAPLRFCNQYSCDNPMKVIETDEPIKHIDFYPGRDDVIIYSTKSGVFVVEVDRRPEQVHRRIFFGNDIDFRVSGGRIYLKDGSALAVVNL